MNRDYDLSPSLEDYLEVIWDLEEINTVARVKDISERLEVKRSSVTIALRSLGEKGLVNYAPYSVITLTDEGKRVGSEIRAKHNLLRSFFTDLLGVDIVSANGAACSMEHGLTPSIQRRLETLMAVWSENNTIKSDLASAMDKYDELHNITRDDTPLPLISALHTLSENEEGVIYQILDNVGLKKRLMEMGINTGHAVKVLSAKEGKLIILLKNYRISITEHEASHILIEKR